jgi:hypothetical protein
MVQGRRAAYVVRDAGTPSRLGKVYKVYPYTLRALIDAMEDARFRSFAGDPQVVVRVRAEFVSIRSRWCGYATPVDR